MRIHQNTIGVSYKKTKWELGRESSHIHTVQHFVWWMISLSNPQPNKAIWRGFHFRKHFLGYDVCVWVWRRYNSARICTISLLIQPRLEMSRLGEKKSGANVSDWWLTRLFRQWSSILFTNCMASFSAVSAHGKRTLLTFQRQHNSTCTNIKNHSQDKCYPAAN